MAEEKPTRTFIPLDSEIEGDRDATSDFVFVRVGESIPLKPADSAFDATDPPSHPLAVSEQHRLLFLAHSEGFLVARTKDVIGAAKEVKEKGKGPSIEGASVVDVKIGRVSILAISKDESTLAATVAGDAYFFSVAKLLDKDHEPSFSCSLNDSCTVKDFRWQKTAGKSFLVLSSDGSLSHGSLGFPLKDVLDNVDTADWSMKGGFVAIARKNTLRILSSNFDEKLSMSLLFQSWLTDADAECSIKVDSLKWFRDDSIIIGCLRVNEDGNEEGYLVHVITSGEHKWSEISCKPVVYSFPDPFDGIMDDILPNGSGPYLLASYLDCWEVILVSNKKAVDQHVLLLKWSADDDRRVVSLEFKNDKYTPKIDLQENGDDNIILGLGVDRFSLYEKITIKLDSTDLKELSPCCLLLCITVEGKLIIYHAARLSEPSDRHQTSHPFLDDNEFVKERPIALNSFDGNLPESTLSLNGYVDDATSDDKLKGISKVGSNIRKDPSEVWRENIFPGKMQEADGSQLGLLTDQVRNFDKSSIDSTHSQVSRSVLRSEVKSGTQMLSKSSAQNSTEEPSAHKGPAEVQKENIISGKKQLGDGVLSGILTGQVTTFDKSSIELPQLQVSGPFLSSVVTLGAQTPNKSSADNNLSTTSPVLSIPSNEAASRHASSKVAEKTSEVGKGVVGSSSISGAPFGSQSTRSLFGADCFNANQSVTALGRSVLNTAKQNSLSNEFQHSGQLFNAKGSNRDQQSFTFSSNKAPQIEGHTNSLPRSGNAVHAFGGSSISAQEGSLLGKLQYSAVQPSLESKAASSSAQMLNSEPKLSKQFYNVKDMAKELDTLLSFIEREGGFKDVCTVLQENSLLTLENGLENLSKMSRMCKKKTEEQLMEIQQLQNKKLQVSARQIYMKDVVEQASSGKYWDIWKEQMLSSEFEVKRQHIFELQQNLSNQLIELERHFNNLEISRFGESGTVPAGKRVSRSPVQHSRQIQSFHSVYNTLNSQLVAAEHLSECLAAQMSMLNIKTPVKRQNIAKELFDSIGLPHEASTFHSPDSKRLGLSPESIKRTSTPSNTIEECQRKNTSSALKSFEPETARRRRDSLGRSWATFEPPKTTVKRITQEERSRAGPDEPFRKAKETFDSQLEAFGIQQKNNARPSPFSLGHSLKGGIQESAFNQMSELRSNSVFRWAKDVSNLSQSPGPNTRPIKTMHNVTSQPSLSMAPSPPIFSGPQSNTKVLFGSPDISGIGSSRTGIQSTPAQNITFSSAQASSMFPGSMSPMMAQKDQANKNWNLKMVESVITSAPRSLQHLTENQKSSSSITRESNITSFTAIPAISVGINGNSDQFTKSTIRNKSTESAFMMPASTEVAVSTPNLSVPLSNSATSASASSTLPLPATSSSIIAFGNSSFSTKTAGITNLTAPMSASTSDSNRSLLSTSLELSQPQKSLMSTTAPSSILTSLPPITSGESSLGSKPVGETNQAASVSTLTSVPSGFPPFSTSSLQPSQSSKLSLSTSMSSTTSQSPSPLSNAVSSRSEQTPPVTPATELAKSEPAKSQAPVAAEVSATGKEPHLLPTNIGSMPLASSSFQPQKGSFGSPNLSATNTGKDEGPDVVLPQEDEMEEEAPDTTTTIGLGSFGGFGLGSSLPSSAPKPNPFGSSFLTSTLTTTTTNSPLTLPASPGELFRPASFSLPSAQPAQISQPVNSGAFSSALGGGYSGFGQPSHVGVGQQALGSVLGSFGQSRQIGSGMPGMGISASGVPIAGGISPTPNSGVFAAAGGFSGGAVGGGFTSVASSGGGFSAAAQGGFVGASARGGFAGATAGGGFAGAVTGGGFTGVASTGGGFAAAGPAGGGFAATSSSGGLGAFGSNQVSGFSSFTGGAGKPPPLLLTQMRK